MTDSFDDDDAAYDFAPREETPTPAPSPRSFPDDIPSPAPPEPTADPVVPDRVTPELICPMCGFEMFEKPRSGRCPDCAAPLDLTSSDLIQFSDAGWIATVSNGALLVGLGIVIDIGAIVVHYLDSPKIGILLHVAAAATTAFGVTLVTPREDSLIAPTSPTAAPAKITAYLLPALWLILLLIGFTGKAPLIKAGTIGILLAYATLANLLAFHFQKLATRIPSDGLAAQSQNLAWLLPVVCLVMLAVNAANMAAGAMLMFFFCSFPLIGGLLGILIWALSVCLRLGLELRQAAAAGESIAIRKAQRLAAKNR